MVRRLACARSIAVRGTAVFAAFLVAAGLCWSGAGSLAIAWADSALPGADAAIEATADAATDATAGAEPDAETDAPPDAAADAQGADFGAAEPVSDVSGAPDAPEPEPPVPGADAPFSASDASSEANVSLEYFLTPDQIAQARAQLAAGALPAANDPDGSGGSGDTGGTGPDDSPERPAVQVTFAQLLVYAEQYLGLPYVWGGKDYGRDGGFDCSGLACWVFNRVAGTAIDSDYTNAAMLYAECCDPVDVADARPGDLVFFKGTYGGLGYISHVGIYCGNGIMIDAGDPIAFHYVGQIRNQNGGVAEAVYGRVRGVEVTDSDGARYNLEELGRIHAADCWYTGFPVEPGVWVSVAGTPLVEGVDVWFEYTDNLEVGTGWVAAHGMGDYTGTLCAPFDVVDMSGSSFPEGYYRLHLGGGDQLLDIEDGLDEPGARAMVYEDDGTASQIFSITWDERGYFTIKNRNSGLSLLHTHSPSSLNGGFVVTQGTGYGAGEDAWMIKRVGELFAIVPMWDSTLRMMPVDGIGANDAVVVLDADADAPLQLWGLEPVCVTLFDDAPFDAWYSTGGYLEYVVDAGLMTGIKDAAGNPTGLFNPEGTLTRAQVATVLYRSANPGSADTDDPSRYGTVSHFDDVATGAYYTAAVEWCYQNGVITGYTDAGGNPTGLFGPEDNVTREQLATMVCRLAARLGVDVAAYDTGDLQGMGGFRDVSVYARESVCWCISSGIITGDTTTGTPQINPAGNATRCQMAKIVTVLVRDVLGRS